ncbi:MAG: hypothetical protein IJ766_03265 [Clostridia bacterium]|nr:hypothetical protein [Clostridia bacterium]
MKKPLRATLALVLSLLMFLSPLSGIPSILGDLAVDAHAADYNAMNTYLNTLVSSTATAVQKRNAEFHLAEVVSQMANELAVQKTGNHRDAYAKLAVNVSTSGVSWTDVHEVRAGSGNGNFLAAIRNTIYGKITNTSDAKKAYINKIVPVYANDGYSYDSPRKDDHPRYVTANWSAPYALADIGTSRTQTFERSLSDALDEYLEYKSAADITKDVTSSSFTTTFNTKVTLTYNWNRYRDSDNDGVRYSGTGYLNWAYVEYYYFTSKPARSIGTTTFDKTAIVNFIKRFGRTKTATAGAAVNVNDFDSLYALSSGQTAAAKKTALNTLKTTNQTYITNCKNNSYWSKFITNEFMNTNASGNVPYYMNQIDYAIYAMDYVDDITWINNEITKSDAVTSDAERASQQTRYDNITARLNKLKNALTGGSGTEATRNAAALAQLKKQHGLQAWSAYEAYLAGLKKNLDYWNIRKTKAEMQDILAFVKTYEVPDTEAEEPHLFAGDSATNITNSDVIAKGGLLKGKADILSGNTYDAAMVAEVLAEGTPLSLDEAYAYVSKLAQEAKIREYEPKVITWIGWYVLQEGILDANGTDMSDAELNNMAIAARNKLSEVQAGYNDLAAYIGTSDTDIVFADDATGRTVVKDMEALYHEEFLMMVERLRPEVEAAYKLYTDEGSKVNVANFQALKYAINHLNTVLNGYLKADTYGNSQLYNAANSTAQVKSIGTMYDELKAGILTASNNFTVAGYERINLETIDSDGDGVKDSYAVREGDSDADLARETGEDYYADNLAVETAIKTIDDFLTGEDFAKNILTFKKTNEDGTEEPYKTPDGKDVSTLSELVDAIMRDKLFSDKIMNQLVGLLYPSLCNVINFQLSNALFNTAGTNANKFDPLYLQNLGIDESALKAEAGSSSGAHASASLSNISGTVNIYFNGKNGTQSLAKLLHDAEIDIYPAYLANHVSDFPKVKAALTAASGWSSGYNMHGAGTYMNAITGDWNGINLTTGEVDTSLTNNGYNPYLYTKNAETGKYELNLTWDINGSVTLFKNALTDIINSILPAARLALTGLSSYSKYLGNVGYATSNNLKAKGTAQAGINFINITPSLNASASLEARAGATITISSNGFNGFKTLVVPIYEALGVTDYEYAAKSLASLSANASAADIVNAIVNPLLTLIDQVSAHPLDKVLSILPNLSYAVTFDRIQALINKLPTLNVSAKLKVESLGVNNLSILPDGTWSWIKDPLDSIATKLVSPFNSAITNALNNNVPAIPLALDLAGMINLSELLGVDDITSISDIMMTLVAKADNPQISGLVGSLPFINGGKISALGVRDMNAPTVRSGGNRINIKADKPDIFWDLLDYIGRALTDKNFVNVILSFLPESLSENELLDQILEKITTDPAAVAIAIIELLVPQAYAYKAYDWRLVDDDPAVKGADGIYLNYSTDNQWSSERAQYVFEHIDDVINSLTDGEAADISTRLRQILTRLFTKDNALTLAKMLGTIASIADEQPLLNSIFSDAQGLNIDTAAWADYKVVEYEDGTEYDPVKAWKAVLKAEDEANKLLPPAERTDVAYKTIENLPEIMAFDDGDEAAFKKALTTIIKPLTPPIMKYLLTGEDVHAIKGGSGNRVVTLKAYEGYTYGLLPLLNALGINAPKSTAAFVDAVENAEGYLKGDYSGYLINMIFERVDYLLSEDSDIIKELLTMLPNLLYLVDTNALVPMIENLAKGPLTLLDTLRPVYDILNDLALPKINELLTATGEDAITNLLGDEANLPIITDVEQYLSVDNLLYVAEKMTGMSFSGIVKNAIDGFVMGNLESYTGTDRAGNTQTYYQVKMTTDPNDGNLHTWDSLTLLLEVLMEVGFGKYTTDSDNMVALSTILTKSLYELRDKDPEAIAAAIGTAVSALFNESERTTLPINWTYFDEGNTAWFETGSSIKTANNDKTNRTVYKLDKLYNSWSEEAATYLTENFEEIVNEVLAQLNVEFKIAGKEIKIEKLSDVAANLSNFVYTNEILSKVVVALSKVLDGDGEKKGISGEIIDIVGKLIGTENLAVVRVIDGEEKLVSCFYDAAHDLDENGVHNFGFADGDKDGFVAALSDLFTPLNGVLRWYLLGQDLDFFYGSEAGKLAEKDGAAMFTVKGNSAYDNVLVPLLESLLAEPTKTSEELLAATAPVDGKTSDSNAIIAAILDPIANLIDKIAADPTFILDIIPNFVYYVNAGGLTSAAYNALNMVVEVIDAANDAIGAFKDGAEIDITGILDYFMDAETVFENGEEVTYYNTFDLSWAKIIADAEKVLADNGSNVNLHDTLLPLLSGLFVGNLEAYTSVNGNPAIRMTLKTEEDRAEMLTILIAGILTAVKHTDNRAVIVKLLDNIKDKDGNTGNGDKYYQVIYNMFRLDELLANVENVELQVQDIDWLYGEEIADTDVTVSPFGSEEWNYGGYDQYWTVDKAKYVASHLENCVDNTIALLGLGEIIDLSFGSESEENISSIKDILNNLVGTKLYTADLVNKVLALIKEQVLPRIDELPLAKHIREEIKNILGVDVTAYENMSEFSFADGDRAAFTDAIVTVLRPVERVLLWLLSGEADANYEFFYVEENGGKSAITLVSTEGYAYGIVPILEALECKGIVTPAAFNKAAREDADTIILNIVNPILDKIDAIMEAPADQILQMLPNVIFFLNSHGVETSLNNLLRSVRAVLTAVSPAFDEPIDLYKTLNLNFDDLNPDFLLDYAIDALKNVEALQEFDFDSLDLRKIVVQLTVGKVTSYTSKNGKTAYRMGYSKDDTAANEGALITMILRFALDWLLEEENQEAVINFINNNVKDEQVRGYLLTTYDTMRSYVGKTQGDTMLLGFVYYIFFAWDKASDAINGRLQTTNDNWKFVIGMINGSDDSAISSFGDMLSKLFGSTEDVMDENGIASKGLIPFFQKIANWFRALIDWFKTFFGRA